MMLDDRKRKTEKILEDLNLDIQEKKDELAGLKETIGKCERKIRPHEGSGNDMI